MKFYEPRMRLNLQQFAEPAGGEPAPAGGDNPQEEQAPTTPPEEAKPTEKGAGENDLMAEITRLKAEMAKQKASLDAATSESAKYKRELRAKQSAEEIAAEEKKAQEEAARAEIETLRREVARAKTVKAVMSKLGTDEDAGGKIADYLYGAEDPDAALAELQKVWMAREKALRLEYGKIPPPGAGGVSAEDQKRMAALAQAKQIGSAQAAAKEAAQKAINAYIR